MRAEESLGRARIDGLASWLGPFAYKRKEDARLESPGITTTEARTPDTFILTRVCKLIEMTKFRVTGILAKQIATLMARLADESEGHGAY